MTVKEVNIDSDLFSNLMQMVFASYKCSSQAADLSDLSTYIQLLWVPVYLMSQMSSLTP